MIDKTGASCDGDGCNARVDHYGSSFKGIVNKIKSLGWGIENRYRAWFHYCPTCAQQFKRPATEQRRQQWYDAI